MVQYHDFSLDEQWRLVDLESKWPYGDHRSNRLMTVVMHMEWFHFVAFHRDKNTTQTLYLKVRNREWSVYPWPCIITGITTKGASNWCILSCFTRPSAAFSMVIVGSIFLTIIGTCQPWMSSNTKEFKIDDTYCMAHATWGIPYRLLK